MTELSEFLALLQFEVQKSFDFSEQLMHDLAESDDPVLQLAYDSVELELPLVFDLGTKEAPASPGNAEALPTKPGVVISDLTASFAGVQSIRADKVTARAALAAASAAEPAKATPAKRRSGGAAKKRGGDAAKGKATVQTLSVATLEKAGLESDAIDREQIGRIKVTLKPVAK